MAKTAAEGEGDIRVVLITSCSSDISRAIAVEFAKLGDKIALTGHEQGQLDSILNELHEVSPVARPLALNHFLVIRANFEHEDEVDQVVPRVVAVFGRIDVLIINSDWPSCSSSDLFDQVFFDDFQKVLRVNLMSAVRLAQTAAPHLGCRRVSDKQAVLINVSSPVKQLSHCVSNAGLSMLTKTLANSFEGKNVRVLCIAPGPVSPIKLARKITFLASDQNSYMHGCTVDL